MAVCVVYDVFSYFDGIHCKHNLTLRLGLALVGVSSLVLIVDTEPWIELVQLIIELQSPRSLGECRVIERRGRVGGACVSASSATFNWRGSHSIALRAASRLAWP